jgi:aspartate/methionine/tyrosine aminotransferase
MQIAERMQAIPFTPIRKIFEEAARREASGDSIIHLEMGRPDFDTPRHIKDAAHQALDDGHVHYSSNYGIPELRRAIAAKFQRDNALIYDPATEIIVTVGATEGIFMTMMALLNPGDEVLIPTPTFPCYLRCAHMAGAIPVEVPLHEAQEFKPKLQDFRDRISPRTRMLVLNTPHNPTGTIFTADVMQALAELACEHDLYLLADEIYEKNIYAGYRHVSIATLPGMQSRTITLNGFSKSYSMTGWRLGYLGTSAELVSVLIRIRQYATVCPTSFAQYGAVAALNGPQDCVAKMVAEFDRRRVLMVERLKAMPELSFVEPKGAFYILVNIDRLPLGPQEMAYYLLDEAKIAVVPWGKHHIRLSYANAYANLQQAMDQMATAIDNLLS